VSGEAGLSLVLLLVLGVAAVLILRRVARLAARTRELQGFQHGALTLDARFAAAAGPLVARLDEIRRRAGDPKVVEAMLPDASEALRAAAADARVLPAPRPLTELRAGLVRELDRAVRATEMVEHGLDALLTVRGSRELEAQTSLKRGALNLRHAQSAFHQLVMEIYAIRPADIAPRAPARPVTPARAVPTYLVDGIDPDPDGSFDPRM